MAPDRLFIPEADVSIQVLSDIVLSSGREILTIEENLIWVKGQGPTNIQVGNVVNKTAVCIFAARPLTGIDPSIPPCQLAQKLNVELDLVRFYSNYVEVAQQDVLIVDHYISYVDYLLTAHLLFSLRAVEFFSIQFDLASFAQKHFGSSRHQSI